MLKRRLQHKSVTKPIKNPFEHYKSTAKPKKTANKPSEKADDDEPTVPELRGIKEIERLKKTPK